MAFRRLDEQIDWTRRQMREEFVSQPAKAQAATLDRVLNSLAEEYRRRPNVHSVLWRNMDVYPITINLVRVTAERGKG